MSGAVTAAAYRGGMRERERGIVRTIVRVAVGVVLAVLLLAAGCTAMLGSASHDALPAVSDPRAG